MKITEKRMKVKKNPKMYEKNYYFPLFCWREGGQICLNSLQPLFFFFFFPFQQPLHII
ncbi:unnamed protein product, partial [Vitis vinifera]|uniref:Uncharacterized protein n=1 Tax=Vitis vinifera TaxID=29760 RepID=D7SYV1_VITVI